MISTARSSRSFRLASGPTSSWCTASAPALIMALSGRCDSASRESSLKASPEGFNPTCRSTAAKPRSTSAAAYVNGLDADWMVNSTSASPAQCSRPVGVASAMPKRSGSASASTGMYWAVSPGFTAPSSVIRLAR